MQSGSASIPADHPGAAREIAIGYGADPDDAFMFYALATEKIRVPGLKFTHAVCDIETLNRKALEGEGAYDVTAVSFHVYPYLQHNYALLDSGGSLAEGYGPVLIARRPYTFDEIRTVRVAVPGLLTTAYLTLKLFAPDIQTTVVPFDQIIPRVLEGACDAGLLIHEGGLTYAKAGLFKIIDLGQWWQQMQHLPLPLGGNVIRRCLGPELMVGVAGAIRSSIQYALDHREAALQYALQFARSLNLQQVDHFVALYVNERTVDYGEDGRLAVRRLLDLGYKAGVFPHQPKVDFIGRSDTES